jgi:NAD(P)H-hydrate epimerase
VLLKGNHTVVAEPGGRLAVNPTGTPVLATGGTGDVLTGLAGVLLAHGLDPFDTGRLGAWVHGRAGALAARALSPVSVAAADVAEHLPAAFAELLAASPRARSTDMPPAGGPW